jgi:phosphoribosyl-ATP pyrophosphohydrolase
MLDLGTPEIARKIGEEAVETLMAAVCEDGSRLVSETADLWFHCMLLLASRDLSFRDVLAELASRHKPNLGDADVR